MLEEAIKLDGMNVDVIGLEPIIITIPMDGSKKHYRVFLAKLDREEVKGSSIPSLTT